MFLPASLFGQTTWHGGGGDNLFGTSANWAGDIAPTPGSGNDLVFAGSTRLTPSNNHTAFDDWRNILFNSGAGASSIAGEAIDLFGKIETIRAPRRPSRRPSAPPLPAPASSRSIRSRAT